MKRVAYTLVIIVTIAAFLMMISPVNAEEISGNVSEEKIGSVPLPELTFHKSLPVTIVSGELSPGGDVQVYSGKTSQTVNVQSQYFTNF